MDQDDDFALDELMRRKTPPLVRLAANIVGNEEDARDIVQIAFIKVWDSRHRFDRRFSPNTWIYRIVSNLAIDHLRSRKARMRSLEGFHLQLEHQRGELGARQFAPLSEPEVRAIFGQLAQTLTEKQRAVFVLREMEGLKGTEIARILGLRPSTVRNHLLNSRRILRQELLERYPEYARHIRDEETP